jgi:hypothetical protein
MKGVFCIKYAQKHGMCLWHFTQSMTKTTTVATVQVAPLMMMPTTTNANAAALAARGGRGPTIVVPTTTLAPGPSEDGDDKNSGPKGEGNVVKVHEAHTCNDEEDVMVSFADDDSPTDNNVFVGLTMTLVPRPSEVRDNREDDGGSDTDDDSPAPLPDESGWEQSNAVIAMVQAVCDKPASKQGETQQPKELRELTEDIRNNWEST